MHCKPYLLSLELQRPKRYKKLPFSRAQFRLKLFFRAYNVTTLVEVSQRNRPGPTF